MMCGCTLEPAGLWDANRVAVRVQVYGAYGLVREAPLGYVGEKTYTPGLSMRDAMAERQSQ